MEAEEEEQAAYRARNKTFLKAEAAAAAAAVTAAENASNGSGSVSDNSSGSPLRLQPTVPTPPLMTGKEAAAAGGEGEEEEDAGSSGSSPVLDALRTETREVRTARRQAEADTRFAASLSVSVCVCGHQNGLCVGVQIRLMPARFWLAIT